jgi:hypothetical protein
MEKVNEDGEITTTSVGNTTDANGNNVGNSSIYKKKLKGGELLKRIDEKDKERKYKEGSLLDKIGIRSEKK